MILYKIIHQEMSSFLRVLRKNNDVPSSFGYFYNNFMLNSHFKDELAEVFIFKYSDYYMSDQDFERTFEVLFLNQVKEYISLMFVYRVDKQEMYVIFENSELGYKNLAKKYNLPCFEVTKDTKKLKFWMVKQL